MTETEEELEKITLDRVQIEEICSGLVAFVGLDMARLSMVFLAQLLQIYAKKVFNIHEILDEVRSLESERFQSRTKRAELFRHEPLKGLMKTHFMDARFILRNIGIHMGLDTGGNERLERLINNAFERNTSGVVDDEFVNFISQGMSVGAIEERSKARRMTGEWIVFQQYEGKNYYLTLASHRESNDAIYKRVCDCYELDYPDLRLKQ